MNHLKSVLVASITLIWLLATAQSVAACSGPEPTIKSMAETAQVVAIGILQNPTDDTVTLEVEEYLKGEEISPTLRLNNHSFMLADDCSLSLGPGRRFDSGGRFLAFLQRDGFNVGAEWRPSGPGAMYMLPITDNDQVQYVQLSMGSLSDVKTQLKELVGSSHMPETGTSDMTSVPSLTEAAPLEVSPGKNSSFPVFLGIIGLVVITLIGMGIWWIVRNR